MGSVPRDTLDTDDLDPSERLTTFRRITSAIFDAWPLGDPKAFRVRSVGHHVNSLIFNQVAFTPFRCRRSRKHLDSPGSNFLVLEHQISGTQHLIMPNCEARVLPGSIYLRDWSVGFETFNPHMRLNSILIPREMMAAEGLMGPEKPIISWSTENADGKVLGDLFAQLLRSLDQVQLADAEILAAGFLGYLDALATHGSDASQPTSLDAMQRFLDARLQLNVGVQDLCHHFGVSRASVFRRFKPCGGVVHYIRHTRLSRCYNDLCHAQPGHDKISGIARAWGFHEITSFNRAFKSQFGCTPTSIFGSDPRLDDQPDCALLESRADDSKPYSKWFDDAVFTTNANTI